MTLTVAIICVAAIVGAIGSFIFGFIIGMRAADMAMMNGLWRR